MMFFSQQRNLRWALKVGISSGSVLKTLTVFVLLLINFLTTNGENVQFLFLCF